MNTTTQTLTAQLIQATAFAAADAYEQEVMQGAWGMCGFAWVDVAPKHKGNTTLGKAERQVLTALGFRKDYTGKSYQLWNPSKYGTQNVDTLYAGAAAAAQLLRAYGYAASAGNRLD